MDALIMIQAVVSYTLHFSLFYDYSLIPQKCTVCECDTKPKPVSGLQRQTSYMNYYTCPGSLCFVNFPLNLLFFITRYYPTFEAAEH